MTVLNVAFPFAAAGPDAVGGAEQILARMDEALVAAGHRSIVVAAEGSCVRGTLLPTAIPDGEITDEVRRIVHERHLENIRTALRQFPIDLVHMHGIDFHSYLPPDGPPVLVTLHLPPAWYPQSIWHLERPRTYMHCVSATQQAQCPAGAGLLEPIPNGVSMDAFGYHCSRRRYAIALGRICPEKNFHVAIDAARSAGIPLLIGGQTFPYETHLRYLHEEIEPRLNGTTRYLGTLQMHRKRRLLSGAQCLISASLAAETSSLVAMEALACGTPVVAFPSGALPEIVEHGVTGFLVSDQKEMAQAILRCRELDPDACREAARTRFSLEVMVRRYLKTYEDLIEPPIRLAEEPRPDTITTLSDLAALEPDWHSLWLADPRATVFQSPAWLLPWSRHIADGELLSISLRERGTQRLVGLLPMYIYTQASGSRDLFPLGIATTDYLDQIALPEYAAALPQIAMQEMLRRREDWDVLEFPQLRPDSPLLSLATPEGMLETKDTSEPCLVVTFPSGRSSLADALPWNVVHNLTYYRARASRSGNPRIHGVTTRNVDEIYEALLALHSARWSSRNEPGVLADPRVQEAHRESIPALLRDDCLRMYALRLSGHIIAVMYALADPPGRASRTIYYYLGGFNPEYKALSPGTLLIGHAIEQALAEGFSRFDFLRGRERYKYLWGATDQPTFCRQFRMANRAAPAHEVSR